MSDWRPATVEEVNEIVARSLKGCDSEQLAVFGKYRVDPYLAPIVRYSQMESVVVVARNCSQVIYYEDVEKGFNISPISGDGQVLEHWCNQDELRLALNEWIDGRGLAGRVGPAVSPP